MTTKPITGSPPRRSATSIDRPLDHIELAFDDNKICGVINVLIDPHTWFSIAHTNVRYGTHHSYDQSNVVPEIVQLMPAGKNLVPTGLR